MTQHDINFMNIRDVQRAANRKGENV